MMALTSLARKFLVASDAEKQRAAAAGADDQIGMIGLNDGDAVGADHIFQCAPDGFGKSGAVGGRVFGADLFVVLAHEVGEDFGVGLGSEGVAFGDQLFLELLVILNDAVVDKGDLAGLIEMRMGIRVRGRPMRGPAGVANAGVALGRLLGEEGGEIVDAAALFAELEFSIVHEAETGGVVATVFETAESFEDDGLSGPLANVANDATHGVFLV